MKEGNFLKDVRFEVSTAVTMMIIIIFLKDDLKLIILHKDLSFNLRSTSLSFKAILILLLLVDKHLVLWDEYRL
jgi:hypothetical protein